MSGAIFHGGGLDAAIAEHGGRRTEWLDLSTGINPVPWPVPPVSGDAWHRLPGEAAMLALLDAARHAYGVPDTAGIAAANGTQALIEILPRVTGIERVAIVSPTYQEHAHVWGRAGATVREIASPEMVAEDESLVIVNPNNPDGRRYGRETIADEAARLAARGNWLIADEAFMDCFPEASLIPALPGNAIVLRSFGKFFGLAGVRLGFAIARPELTKRIADALGPWSVSGLAIEIGTAALADGNWASAMRLSLAAQSQKLAGLLSDRGLGLAGTHPLFVQVRHGNAIGVQKALARRHILVRHFPGRPEYLRFGLPGSAEAMKRLDRALRETMQELGALG